MAIDRATVSRCLLVIFTAATLGFTATYLAMKPSIVESAPVVLRNRPKIVLPSPPPFAVTSPARPYRTTVVSHGQKTTVLTNLPKSGGLSKTSSRPNPAIYRPAEPEVMVDQYEPQDKVAPRPTLIPSHAKVSLASGWARPSGGIYEQNISSQGSGQIAEIKIEFGQCRLNAYNNEGILEMGVMVALGKQDSTNRTPLGHYQVSELYLDPEHRPSPRVAADEGLPGGTIAPWRSYFPAKTRNEGNPNGLGAAWIGLSGNGTSGLGIHGTNDPNSIGTYASDGCIRMRNEDVIVLVRMCRPGRTTVEIIQ